MGSSLKAWPCLTLSIPNTEHINLAYNRHLLNSYSTSAPPLVSFPLKWLYWCKLTYNKLYIFKVCYLMSFEISTYLWNPHHNQDYQLSQPRSFLRPLPSSPPSHSSTGSHCLLSLQFLFSVIFYKWNHTGCSAFCLASFTQHDSSELHPCCYMY